MTLLDKVLNAQQSHEERIKSLIQAFSEEVQFLVQTEVSRQLPTAVQRAMEIGIDPRIYK